VEIRNGRVSNVVGDGLEGVEMIEVSQRGDQMEWKKEERGREEWKGWPERGLTMEIWRFAWAWWVVNLLSFCWAETGWEEDPCFVNGVRASEPDQKRKRVCERIVRSRKGTH
jgi:hypothetical protein